MKKITSLLLALVLAISLGTTFTFAENTSFTAGEWNEDQSVFTSTFSGFQFTLPEGFIDGADILGEEFSTDPDYQIDFVAMNATTGDSIVVIYSEIGDVDVEVAIEEATKVLAQGAEEAGAKAELGEITLFDQVFQSVILTIEIPDVMVITQQHLFRQVDGYLQNIVINIMNEDALTPIYEGFAPVK